MSLPSSAEGVRWIATEGELRQALSELSQATELAVDTEADGMFRYRARLCTIQVQAGSDTYVFDTLALGAHTAQLSQIFGDAHTTKIIHDVFLDARMLSAAEVTLERVFDTSVAARFLGLPATGLSNLLEARFGIVLDKSHQQADWGKRPLADELLRYLRDDVLHLSALAAALREEVRARDIADEVEEETRYMLGQAVEPAELVPPWTKVRGAQQLKPVVRGVLAELCNLREALAEGLDMPAGRVLSGEQLLRLAELGASDGAVPKLPSALAVLLARFDQAPERVLEAIARGRERGDAPADEVRKITPEPLSASEIEARKLRRKLLTELRAREAKVRGVDLQVVLPGHCLNDLTAVHKLHREALLRVRGFGEARLARYGARWLAELAPHWPM